MRGRVYEQEMWEDGLDFIVEGEVFTWDDRPLHLRAMVQRRWGWPKKSAYAAADFLRQEAGLNPAVVWLRKSHRQKQQQEIIEANPGILADLLSGLSRGVAQREIFDAGRDVGSITVELSGVITDEGVITEVLRGLGWRFGANMDEMRQATQFSTDAGNVRLTVDVARFDL